MPGSGGALDGTQLYTIKHTYTQTGITDLKAFTGCPLIEKAIGWNLLTCGSIGCAQLM